MKKLITMLFVLMCIPQTLFAHGISEADKLAMLDGGYLQYIELGATHMLTGYDHLLFLFGVMFFLTKFKDIAKFITAFTIGHSITLLFATYMQISANFYIVDAVIALTVVYKGFDNIEGFKKYLNMESPNLLALVFGFGLIHGFGLSTRLQQLPLGEEGLFLRIISFNVGVEVGQIVALSLMLLVLMTWRKSESFRRFSLASNVGLMIAGALLFLMQMHGYSHDVMANEMASEQVSSNQAGIEAVQNATIKDSLSSNKPAETRWQDSTKLLIHAGQGREYKFYVLEGDTLAYSWKTNGEKLYYDFHGEPKGAAADYFESFKEDTESESSGSLNARFDGSHGWYWKNNGTETIELTLQTKGTYEILGIR